MYVYKELTGKGNSRQSGSRPYVRLKVETCAGNSSQSGFRPSVRLKVLTGAGSRSSIFTFEL